VQTAFSALPKLDALRLYSEAPPIIGARYTAPNVLKALGSKRYHDIFSIGYGVALRRYSGSHSAFIGALRKISVALLGREVAYSALNVDLSLHLVPQKCKCHMGVCTHLPPLTALVVAVKNKLIVEHLLE
jgi:hypothetical protein